MDIENQSREGDKMNYFCPKCGSENIEIVCLNAPKPERISLDDIEKIGIKLHLYKL